MPARVLLEEFHLTVTVSRSVPPADRDRHCAVLRGRAFRAALRRAVRDLARAFPALARARLTVSA